MKKYKSVNIEISSVSLLYCLLVRRKQRGSLFLIILPEMFSAQMAAFYKHLKNSLIEFILFQLNLSFDIKDCAHVSFHTLDTFMLPELSSRT